jgi:hypothetical protein
MNLTNNARLSRMQSSSLCSLRSWVVWFTVSLGCVLLLQGCSTSGNQKLKDQTQSTIEQKIIVGTTTQSMVRQEFGDPYSSITTDGGGSIWIYRYQHGTPWNRNFIPIYNLFDSGTDLDISELIVGFGSNGIVKKTELRKISDVSKRGLLVQ